ncbi:hypothetical protein Tco_1012506 [Tanacetum coccineum]
MTETMEQYMRKKPEEITGRALLGPRSTKMHTLNQKGNFSKNFAAILSVILDSKGVIPTKTTADAKVAIQEMTKFSQKWHNGTSSKTRSIETSDGLAAIKAQLNNLRREIKKVNEKVYAAQVR